MTSGEIESLNDRADLALQYYRLNLEDSTTHSIMSMWVDPPVFKLGYGKGYTAQPTYRLCQGLARAYATRCPHTFSEGTTGPVNVSPRVSLLTSPSQRVAVDPQGMLN